MQIQELLKQRRERGYEIAKKNRIVNTDGVWLVPSQTDPKKTYQVVLTLTGGTCTCEDYKERGIRCKHLFSVEYTIKKTLNKNGTSTIVQTKKITYPQDWKNYDLANTQQKDLFIKLLNGLCTTITEPIPKATGRPPLPLADMVFLSGLKIYTNFSLRRFMSDANVAKERGYVSTVPHFSMIGYYMEKPELTPILKTLIMLSSLPLKTVEDKSFSIDSSGISPSKFSRWFDHKYGKEIEKRIWYKAHILTGNKTHVVCGVEITSQFVNDSKLLPQLLEETSQNFDVKILTADKGYNSLNNLSIIDDAGIIPIIPFKKNARIPEGTDIWRKMYDFFTFRRAEFLEVYHQRSNIETAFHMIKSKFGDFVRSKTETACINEILLKVLCHNICVLISEMFELGIEPNFLKV